MKKFTLIISMVVFLFVLVGCSSKPNDVRQELWDEGLKVYQDLSQSVQNGSEITDEQTQRAQFLFSKYNGTTLTESETFLLYNLMELSKNAIEIKVSKLQHDIGKTDSSVKKFVETSNSLKEIFKN